MANKRITRQTTVAVLILALAGFSHASIGADKLDELRSFEGGEFKLEQAVANIAESFAVPILGEFAQPVGSAHLAPGIATPRDLLNDLVRQNSDYDWRIVDGVVHFYHKGLFTHSQNPLNWEFDSFTISETVGEVELRLRARLGKVQRGVIGEGGLRSGIARGDMESRPLPRKVLQNVTARDVVFETLRLDGGVYTLITFPTASPGTRAEFQTMLRDWKWRPF